MGSGLGPLFANFYMANLETSVLKNMQPQYKPFIYCRFVDDIFLLVNSIGTLEQLKTQYENNSVLNFTYEIECKNKLPFLDVIIQKSGNKLNTSVFTKSTNSGDCLNYNSLAPEKYKLGVVKTMLNRAYKISSTYEALHSELDRLRQLFTNNNYPMKVIETEINRFLNMKFENTGRNSPEPENLDTINLFYRGQMSNQYKQEEKNLRNILSDNITPRRGASIKLSVYYKNTKLSQLLIKNNIHQDNSKSHVVYKYTCNQVECQPHKYYIGYTTTTLKQRMLTHNTNRQYAFTSYKDTHTKRRTAELLETTTPIHKSQDRFELQIAEALFIKSEEPSLNNQREGETRILHVF
jgi:predicted GIY-YIG superfamily endonuclease